MPFSALFREKLCILYMRRWYNQILVQREPFCPAKKRSMIHVMTRWSRPCISKFITFGVQYCTKRNCSRPQIVADGSNSHVCFFFMWVHGCMSVSLIMPRSYSCMCGLFTGLECRYSAECARHSVPNELSIRSMDFVGDIGSKIMLLCEASCRGRIDVFHHISSNDNYFGYRGCLHCKQCDEHPPARATMSV